jgi:cytochrome c oxidase subunit 3
LWWAEAAIRRGDRPALASRLLLALAFSAAFLGLQLWVHLVELEPAQRHARYALSHATALYQGFHLVIAMTMAAMVVLRARRGDFAPDRHLAVRIAVRFGTFAAGLWLVGFPLVHLAPWLFLR